MHIAENEANFSQLRYNMVHSQLMTSQITSVPLLKAFMAVHREEYVPEAYKSQAYCDERLPLTHNRSLLAPLTLARLLEAADLSQNNKALVIGCGLGYACAILSQLVASVIGLEEDLELVAAASNRLPNANSNIIFASGPLQEGSPQQAPFDIIVIEGAVEEVPQPLFNQLTPAGKILTLVRSASHVDGLATAISYIKTPNEIEKTSLFQTSSPQLTMFNHPDKFKF